MGIQRHVYRNGCVSFKNETTFNNFFNENYKRLVLFAKNYMNNDVDSSEDSVQNVFVNILKLDKEFKDREEALAYMYTSVRNTCLNQLKSNKVRSLYAAQLVNVDKKEMFFLNKLLEEEIYGHLNKSISDLPARCSEVFKLSLKGMRNAEIAACLEISIETVKSQKKRGKKLLKKMVAPFL